MKQIEIKTEYNVGFLRLPNPQITISGEDLKTETYSCIFDDKTFHLPQVFRKEQKIISSTVVGTPGYLERLTQIPK